MPVLARRPSNSTNDHTAVPCRRMIGSPLPSLAQALIWPFVPPLASRPSGAFYYNRRHRGSGILLDPAFDRLARLQRLHQGVRRSNRPTRSQGQHGHRLQSMPWKSPARSIKWSCSPAMAIPLARRGRTAARRARHRGVRHLDDRRRVAPPGRRVSRYYRTTAQIGRDPAERAAREAREPRERHTPQFLQRSAAPQRAAASALVDDDHFDD